MLFILTGSFVRTLFSRTLLSWPALGQILHSKVLEDLVCSNTSEFRIWGEQTFRWHRAALPLLLQVHVQTWTRGGWGDREHAQDVVDVDLYSIHVAWNPHGLWWIKLGNFSRISVERGQWAPENAKFHPPPLKFGDLSPPCPVSNCKSFSGDRGSEKGS